MNNSDEVEVTCTDNGKKVTGFILHYRPMSQLEVSLNTVKIKLSYQNGFFVGSMAGMEFTVDASSLPIQNADRKSVV